MKILSLRPNGWKCRIEECPPGLFCGNNCIGFKSEYSRTVYKGKEQELNMPDCFVAETGEYYCGEGEVQPLIATWEDTEEPTPNLTNEEND